MMQHRYIERERDQTKVGKSKGNISKRLGEWNRVSVAHYPILLG